MLLEKPSSSTVFLGILFSLRPHRPGACSTVNQALNTQDPNTEIPGLRSRAATGCPLLVDPLGMEKEMETLVYVILRYIGAIEGLCMNITATKENEVQKKIDNSMETGIR